MKIPSSEVAHQERVGRFEVAAGQIAIAIGALFGGVPVAFGALRRVEATFTGLTLNPEVAQQVDRASAVSIAAAVAFAGAGVFVQRQGERNLSEALDAELTQLADGELQ